MAERLINAYTVSPDDIQPGDVMLFVVKAQVMYRDSDGQLRYRLYRCPWQGHFTDLPQGSQTENMKEVCEAFFPSLAQVAIPG